MTESLETLSAVAGRQGDPRTGALLIGAAGALRTAAGGIRQPDEDAVGRSGSSPTCARRSATRPSPPPRPKASELDLADAVARALALSAR